MDALRERLAEAVAKANEKAEALAMAQAAVERASRFVRAAEGAVDRLDAADTKDVENLAGRLRTWAQKGTGAQPAIEPNPDRAAARIKAQGELDGAKHAAVALQADVNAAQAGHAVAQGTVDELVALTLRAQGEMLAASVRQCEQHAGELRQQLVDLSALRVPTALGLIPMTMGALAFDVLNGPPFNIQKDGAWQRTHTAEGVAFWEKTRLVIGSTPEPMADAAD